MSEAALERLDAEFRNAGRVLPLDDFHERRANEPAQIDRLCHSKPDGSWSWSDRAIVAWPRSAPPLTRGRPVWESGSRPSRSRKGTGVAAERFFRPVPRSRVSSCGSLLRVQLDD